MLLELRFEVQDSTLVRWQHDLDREELAAFALRLFRGHLLDECANQAVHHAVLVIAFVSVAEHFITDDGYPVRLVPVCLCLEQTLALKGWLGVFIDVAKAGKGSFVDVAVGAVFLLVLRVVWLVVHRDGQAVRLHLSALLHPHCLRLGLVDW